jgi:hypothetical protein
MQEGAGLLRVWEAVQGINEWAQLGGSLDAEAEICLFL